jgi:hypothetical protein
MPLESDEEFLDGLSPCTRIVDSDPDKDRCPRDRGK